MAYNDLYRVSVHAVIVDPEGKTLLLKDNYGAKAWSLPGGAVDKGETVHDALVRECQEELGVSVEAKYLSGIYYHSDHNSHAMLFRCEIKGDAAIKLSSEHTDFKFFPFNEMRESHQIRIGDCLNYTGTVVSRRF